MDQTSDNLLNGDIRKRESGKSYKQNTSAKKPSEVTRQHDIGLRKRAHLTTHRMLVLLAVVRMRHKTEGS